MDVRDPALSRSRALALRRDARSGGRLALRGRTRRDRRHRRDGAAHRLGARLRALAGLPAERLRAKSGLPPDVEFSNRVVASLTVLATLVTWLRARPGRKTRAWLVFAGTLAQAPLGAITVYYDLNP